MENKEAAEEEEEEEDTLRWSKLHSFRAETTAAAGVGEASTAGPGQIVVVENDCTEISPSQKVQITVKTVPSYCGVTWKGTYEAPAGRLSYDINPQRKELSVVVSDMLEDHNYHLRLCRKDFICIGTGANTLIRKEQPIKNATLLYSRPLPCLCIEGWSAVMDAPRVQVCPFKGRLEELWFGITFDPLEGALSWEPACPVAAVVVLCQKREGAVCLNLPNASQDSSRDKEKDRAVDLNLTGELCNSCLQVKRLDVTFAATVIYCFEQCNQLRLVRPVISSQASWDLTWVVVPAGVCLSAIIIVTLALHVLLTVYKRRKQTKNGGCCSDKKTSAAFEVPEFQTQPVLHRGILIPDSPQCGNTEKANLISD
ncbi:hypothetical protein L3Q82_000581 [Scortum barcoo]|uniref:Uncharacterized protein n=1 Tax=Scortum barcoo TaxID=214431 RepID=A0ACB8WF64_9TELE|nr:hypothetical protein L3Q82_000581 [Scortum barcoo]